MKNKRLLFIAILLVFTLKASFAQQQSNTLYFMDWVPQSNYLNPAKQAKGNFYLGWNYQFYAGNSALCLKDLLIPDAASDSSFLSLHNLTDRNDLMNNFKKVNYLSGSTHLNFLSFGFKSGWDPDMYITFDYSYKIEGTFSYTHDFMSLILEQQFAPQDVTQTWKKMGLNLTAYSEIAVGVSKVIDNSLTVGIRPKLLFGKANAVVKFKEFEKSSSMSEWAFDADLVSHFSSSFPVHTDSIAKSFVNDSIDYGISVGGDDVVSSLLTPKNFGFGIDVGAVYSPSNELELSASILDLGFIRWGNNTYNANSSGTFTFTGQEITNLKQVLNDSTTEMMGGLLDTIMDIYKVKENNDPYWQALSGKLYLGARYFVLPKISIGALSVSRLYQGRVRQSFTLSSNFHVSKYFSSSISYSMSNYTFNNLGVGINFRTIPILWFAPCNTYFIVDKIPLLFTSDMKPLNMQYATFRFGVNIQLGTGNKIKDIPMIE